MTRDRARDYAGLKALEALEAAGNDRREAALLLRVWAESDAKLKGALVAPFLGNLCALAVQRALAGQAARRKSGARRARPAGAAGAGTGASPASILEALVGGGQSMSSTRRAASPPAPGSVRHRQAVTLLANAFKPGSGKPGSGKPGSGKTGSGNSGPGKPGSGRGPGGR